MSSLVIVPSSFFLLLVWTEIGVLPLVTGRLVDFSKVQSRPVLKKGVVQSSPVVYYVFLKILKIILLS